MILELTRLDVAGTAGTFVLTAENYPDPGKDDVAGRMPYLLAGDDGWMEVQYPEEAAALSGSRGAPSSSRRRRKNPAARDQPYRCAASGGATRATSSDRRVSASQMRKGVPLN